MTRTREGPAPGRERGPVELSLPGGNDVQANSPIQAHPQAKVLRLVRPPRPRHTPGRRAPVRIVAIDGRFPNHRVFSFDLDDRELDDLIAHAKRLGAMR
jgi:hypothetical protein